MFHPKTYTMMENSAEKPDTNFAVTEPPKVTNVKIVMKSVTPMGPTAHNTSYEVTNVCTNNSDQRMEEVYTTLISIIRYSGGNGEGEMHVINQQKNLDYLNPVGGQDGNRTSARPYLGYFSSHRRGLK